VAPPGSRALAFALFVLGLGWCCSFVAASALLTESTPAAGRLRVQGRVDSVVWGGSAAAGLSSGVLLSFVGYEVLSYTGAAVALLPLLWLRLRRRPARLPSTAAGG
jgi:MFS family permease